MSAEVEVRVTWNIPVLRRSVISPLIGHKTTKSVDEAKRLCPVGKTGHMRDSIHGDVDDEGVGHVYCDDPKYNLVAGGTRPHPIDPINARALAFAGSGGIKIVGHVDHPGTRANPFLKIAVQNVVGGNL